MQKKDEKTSSRLLLTDHVLHESDLTPGQREVICDFDKWFTSKKSKQCAIKRYGGVAGTGKSALIQYIIHHYNLTAEECYVVAYTGQAVNNLRQRGIMARTIHSTFMHAVEVPLVKNGKTIMRGNIPVTTVKYVPVPRISSKVKLIIVDEASFVSTSLEEILLRYNTPIIEFGDPVQLQPVVGDPCFTMRNLDVFMTDVMRQHMDSGIYRLSIDIRSGNAIDMTSYKPDVWFLYAAQDIEDTFRQFLPFIQASDMIITTTNKQRQWINDLYRKHLIGTDSPYPVKGEKLICRKNMWNMTIGAYPLTNGTIGKSVHHVGRSAVDKSANVYFMDFKPSFVDNDYFDNLMCDATYLREEVGKHDDTIGFTRPGCKFEYAHAITTHCSQGAQADTVLFMDGYFPDPEYLARLRYTAITRAVKKLYYVIPYSRYGNHWTDLRIPKQFSWNIK